jgi:hypothetical protein
MTAFLIILAVILLAWYVGYKARKFKRFNDRIYRDAGAEARKMRDDRTE